MPAGVHSRSAAPDVDYTVNSEAVLRVSGGQDFSVRTLAGRCRSNDRTRPRFHVVQTFPSSPAAAACLCAAIPCPPVKQGRESRIRLEQNRSGSLQEVHLRNKEVAFIAPVGFYQRGRNFIWHAVLVRPELQEVRELPEPVGHEFSVEDVYSDGISEVLSVAVASGQGTTESVHSIVQLDGFNPVVMHQAFSRDNLGECHNACKRISIDWKFERASGTTRPILVETVTTSTGSAPERLRSRKDVKRYVLSGDIFVRAGSAAGRSAE